MKSRLLLTLIFATSFIVATLPSFGQVTATITVTPKDTICAGTPARFRVRTTDSIAHHYLWHINSAIVGSSTATYTSTTLATNDTVWCAVIDSVGDTVVVTSNYIVMTVNPNIIPGPITGGDSVCLGSTLTLADAVSGGTWSVNNTTVASISTGGVVTPLGPGMLRVKYKITTGGCADSVRLNVRIDAPAAPLTSPGTVCLDSIFVMMDSARGGIWSAADTNVAALIIPFGIFQGMSAGTTTISYSLANSCGTFNETASVTIVNCDTPIISGVHAITGGQPLFSVYPNPSNGSVSVMYNEASQQTADAVITNVLGKEVAGIRLEVNKEYTLQTNLSAGVYFITLHTGSTTSTQKILINR